jgi:hypothetical protein
MDVEVRGKFGQVTIFVIVGIVAVVAIIAAIYFMSGVDFDPLSDLSPKALVDKCVHDVVEDSVGKMLANGGEALATQAIMYQGDEWNYLCYQADFYQGCYNIHPGLEAEIEAEIEADTRAGVQGCFDNMREDFENSGYDVNGGEAVYSIDLRRSYVAVNLQKSVDVSRGDISQSFRDFDARVLSPIYDLIGVARDIVNFESQYCNFEYNGYMLLYPKYEIRRIDYSDSKLYRVIDRASEAEFRFAVRSCAFAPGI